jgi:DNA-3-methyladenine glycosylase I
VSGLSENDPPGLLKGGDGVVRCRWAGSDPLYIRYHDEEWGRPLYGDIPLFEKLCLESFQAGLSWITVLRKRENFRRAFAGFDPEALARFTDGDTERLMHDPGIIRNRRKIEAVLHNARIMREQFGRDGTFSNYIWSFAPDEAERPARCDHETLETLCESASSRALAKDLKRRGFRFVGPTTLYALMQSAGLVNDHVEGCAFRAKAEKARSAFLQR